MNTTHLTVIRARLGRPERLGACLHDLLAPAREQAGCLRFEISRAAGDPQLWRLRGTWLFPAAMQGYFAAAWLQRVLDRALAEGLIASLAGSDEHVA